MRSTSSRIAAVMMTLLLAACGGAEAPGSSTDSTSAAPVGGAPSSSAPAAPIDPLAAPAMASGTVTGFARTVAVDGVDYDAAADATVSMDVDPRAESTGTMADVKLGQQVDVLLDASGQVTKVFVRATAIGPVESVAAATFKVLGQTIKVVTTGDARTVFEGVDDLTKLKIGDWVEVHGTLDTESSVVATRVEVKPAAGETKVRAGGLVKNLNAAANPKTFKLGDLTINYSSADVKPEGATIANDVFVYVYSDQLPAAGTLVAKAVQVVRMPTLDGRRVSIGGLVGEAAADGKKFKVNGLAVDATMAELKGGQNPAFTDIKLMALVRVEGSLSVAAGVVTLNATRVWLIPASEQRRVLLTGQVTQFTALDKPFAVRGVPVKVDATTRYRGGAAKDLGNNAFVTIIGRIDGTSVKGEDVVFNAPPRGMDLRLSGVVTGYDAAKGEFKLLGIAMKLAPDAVFEGDTKANFSNDDLVEVKGSFDGSVFVVTKVVFKSAVVAPSIYLEGTISNVAATGFTINGGGVKIDANTVVKNGPLANGQRVDVRAQLVGADVVAREVEVQVPSVAARLMGPLSDLKAADKTFVVRGQTVTWGAATQFRGGVEGDLSNGDLVKVDAMLAGGKVNATTVTFLTP